MWEDILEALALGGSGAIGGYRQAKELEEARAERERERMREDRYRQQVLDAQKRQEQRQIDRDIATEQREMMRLGYRQARPDEQVGPMTFQPTGVEIQEFNVDPLELEFGPAQIRAPEVEGGRIAGTGASAAPGQTYSAISKALEDQRPEPAVRTRRVEIDPETLPARAMESATIGGRSYMRVDEGLLSEVERERDRRIEEEATRRENERVREEEEKAADELVRSFSGSINKDQALSVVRGQANLDDFFETPGDRARRIANERALAARRGRSGDGDDIDPFNLVGTARREMLKFITDGVPTGDPTLNIEGVADALGGGGTRRPTPTEIVDRASDIGMSLGLAPELVLPSYPALVETVNKNYLSPEQSRLLDQSIQQQDLDFLIQDLGAGMPEELEGAGLQTPVDTVAPTEQAADELSDEEIDRFLEELDREVRGGEQVSPAWQRRAYRDFANRNYMTRDSDLLSRILAEEPRYLPLSAGYMAR